MKISNVNRWLKSAFYIAVFFIITTSVHGTSTSVAEHSSSNSSSSASSIDIDGNEQFDALTDGLLILRSMFGLTGSSLVAGAVADNAIYADAQEIELRINSLGNKLDIDDNGEVDALTDGLLILRHLFGLTEGTLIQSVVGDGALRDTSADLTAYIDLLMLLDNDGDGVSNENDAFPEDPAETVDTDLDGVGNNADSDDDGDGVNDDSDAFPLDPAETVDTDLDGVGNNADSDDDGDGVNDDSDAFPLDPAETVDTDLDGVGNNADSDDDGDGVNDDSDAYPLISLGDLVDTDSDGIPDDCNDACIELGMAADSDDDGDGVNDDPDAFPLDPAETVDTDLDGVGNNTDTDDDGDFQIDADELTCGSDPLDGTSNSDDFDTDNSPDCVDTDDDNDGVLDINDYYPFEPLISEINCNLVFSSTYPQCLSDSISSSEFYSNGEDVVVLDWDGFSKIPGVIYELQGTSDDDVLIGTDGNDRIEGGTDPLQDDGGYDILVGGLGDDILIGGNNTDRGGCIPDIYRFGDDSGHDLIIGFNPGFSTKSVNTDSCRGVVDRIEIPVGINSSNINSASDILANVTSNEDGWAVITLGGGNTITLQGIVISSLRKESIHVLPITSTLLQGTGTDDVLIGTDGNDRIEGDTDPLDDDGGYDIITGGLGDDVLIGGYNIDTGGCPPDIYRFDDNSGHDVIIGFNPGFSTKSVNTDSCRGVVDRIEIPVGVNSSNINSASDILANVTSNEDGWAVIDLGSDNSVSLLGTLASDLRTESIDVLPITTSLIQGTDVDEVLIGTDGNDRIEGGTDPLQDDGGYDILVGGLGDDILIGGNNTDRGGCIPDIYRFGDDSGHDLIIGFNPGFSTKSVNTDSCRGLVDRIEIPRGINNLNIYTAQDLFDMSTENKDGWVVINLGENNSITLQGIKLNALHSTNFYVLAKSDDLLRGRSGNRNDFLQSTNLNERIEGSDTPISWFSDGSDHIFLNDASIDSVIGGQGNLSTQFNTLWGWPKEFTTDYFFWSGLGDKKIIGFSAVNDSNFSF